MYNKMSKVGTYNDKFNKILDINLPCEDIYQSEGLKKHITKREHNDVLPYLSKLPNIIKEPDYIGVNNREHNSIELIAVFDINILVAIKLDSKDNYLFVSSVYRITDTKLKNRLHSGRLKKYS